MFLPERFGTLRQEHILWYIHFTKSSKKRNFDVDGTFELSTHADSGLVGGIVVPAPSFRFSFFGGDDVAPCKNR